MNTSYLQSQTGPLARLTVFFGIMLLFTGPARADSVELDDGTKYENVRPLYGGSRHFSRRQGKALSREPDP